MLSRRMMMDRTPMTTAGTTGVLRLGSTFDSRELNGRLLSRAIANIMRIVAVWTARQHTVMAIMIDRKSTRLNSSHANISYAVFCLKKKKTQGRNLYDL